MSTDKKAAAEIEEAGHALRVQLLRAGIGQSKDINWLRNLEEADPRVIMAAMVGLGFPGDRGVTPEAARDTARSMLELKLTERMIAKMEDLERASSRLGVIAIIVGALIGIGAPLLQWWLP